MAQRQDISGLDTLDALAHEAERVSDKTLDDRPAEPRELPEVPRAHYDVVGEQGRGGMGRVMVAWDRRLARPVAIKELLSSRSEAEARFVREALVTARLQHPSIVPVHEAGRWPTGEPFYTMKLVQGRPLDAVLRDKKSFAERLALLPVVIAVAEAVAYAHSRRVIHRDLKPANVIIGDFGETILIDWGLAKELGRDESSMPPSAEVTVDNRPISHTADGSVVGTPGFMSPEQAGGESVDIRTDVYALGAMLYNLLTGEIPVRGRTQPELLQAVVDGRMVPIREREAQVPDELVDIVHKAMARRRDDRYESAKELAADLKRFSTGQLVAAHRYSLRELVRRWLWRHRVVVATAGVALLVVALFGAFSVRRVVRERDRADRERALAVAAQARADKARQEEAEKVDELILAQSHAELNHDPTSSIAWLKRLRPGSARWDEAARVAADAQHRGLAERVFAGHQGPVVALAIAHDGQQVATGGADKTTRVWQIAAGKSSLVLGPGPAEITALAFLPDGRRLLAADAKGRLQLWDLTTRVAVVLEGHTDRVTALAVSADGTRALSAGRDGLLRLWDLTDPAPLHSVDCDRPLWSLALSSDGHVAAVRLPGGVRRFDTATLAPLPLADAQLHGDGPVAFAADGSLAAGGAEEVRVWDAHGRSRRLTAEGDVTAVAFSPDGRRLAASSDDGTVRWWELPSGTVHPLAHKGDGSRDLEFSRDGSRLLATRGETVRMWVLPGADPRKLRGPSDEVTRARFTRDGERIVTTSLDGLVRVYRMGPGLGPAEPEAPTGEARLRSWMELVTNAVVQ